ncbi:hypothetical protein AAKU55_000966 [Oxalobacteraceae bacterium GrIS 1.11]
MKQAAAVVASVSALVLAACGGGGSGTGGTNAPVSAAGPLATLNTPQSTIPQSNTTQTNSLAGPGTATNTVQIQLNSGIFFFGGAGSSNNGVDQAYIRKVANGSDASGHPLISTTRYAGADSFLTNGLFDFVKRQVFVDKGWSLTQGAPQMSYGAGNAATMTQHFSETNVADVNWGLSIGMTELNGTPVQDYLKTLPTASSTAAAAGTFGPNAKSLSLTYTAGADTMIAPLGGGRMNDLQSQPITAMGGLVNSASCFGNSATGKYLVLQYQSNGTITMFDTSALPAKQQCVANPPAASSLGGAMFVQKTFGANTYLDIIFPAAFDFSLYNPEFTAAFQSAGVKLAIVQPKQGSLAWSFGYFVPKGVSLTDTIKYMNQEAAAAVRTSLSLPN